MLLGIVAQAAAFLRTAIIAALLGVCAIIIATTIGIAGCFHHETITQPLRLPS